VTAFEPKTLIESVRRAWLDFQREALAVEPTSRGLALAMPHTFPDGWQMVVDLEPGTPHKLKLTDGGRTLGWLAARGQNVESGAVVQQLRSICLQTGMEQEGWELFRWIDAPPAGVDLHVFAEGLSNVAHLCYLHEPAPRSVEVADRTLRRVFTERALQVLEDHLLDGKTERGVRVDYFLPLTHPVAFQVLRRRGRIQQIMEQWGYRWQDLKRTNPLLKPAMVYDPAVQDVDEAAEAIGADVCDLFCAYNETDRIHGLLDSAGGNAS
jgi:hypothetical protein